MTSARDHRTPLAGVGFGTLTRFGAYVLDTGLAALFSLTIMLVAARAGDLAAFGSFAMALAIAGIESSLAVLGVGALVYGRAASRPTTAFRLYWPAVLISLVAGTALYVATLAILAVLASPLLVKLYALAGLRIVGAFGEPLRAICQARSRPGDYVPWRVLTLAAAFAASGAAFLLDAGILWYAAFWGLEWVAFSGILLSLSLRRGVCAPQPRPRVRLILVKASPLFVQSLCIAIYMRFDQLYVGWRFDEAALGIYAAAARVAEAGNMAYGLLGLVIAPRIIREWLAGHLTRPSKTVLILIAVGSVAASGLSAIWGDVVLRLAFGPLFGAGGMILTVYILSTCFSVYGTIGSRLNVAQGDTMSSMLSGMVGAVSNVGLTIALCEFQGPLGAATASLVSYGIAVAIIWHAALRSSKKS